MGLWVNLVCFKLGETVDRIGWRLKRYEDNLNIVIKHFYVHTVNLNEGNSYGAAHHFCRDIACKAVDLVPFLVKAGVMSGVNKCSSPSV